MEHFIKLIPTEKLSDEQKEQFVHLVRSVDPGVSSYYDDGNHVVVELDHNMSEKELDVVFKECEKEYNDFFLMASDEETEEQSTETLPEEVEESSHEKEEPKETSKEEFKDVYQRMCDELEVKLHNRVVDKKTSLGWKFGDKFDPHKKESPLMRNYSDLPEEYKLKNGKIFNDVLEILKKNGFTVSLKK
jgi:hypothetical protein